MRLRFGLIGLGLAVALMPLIARADGPSSKDPYGGSTSINVQVTSTPSGVYIQINVAQSDPGTKMRAPTPPAGLTPVATPPSDPSSGSPTTPTSGTDRTWSDATGIYEQTPNGDLFYLTGLNISSQSDWTSEFQSHPNQTPFVLYLDGQFQSIVWIPNGPSSGSVSFGPPPASTPLPTNPPPGNGSSTDPYQVALSLLDRVPLPQMQIKENPALGLVNLPGWFWIDGYDGKPFGDSQTITIPPAVGPDVPFTVVPASDPRRQPTYLTVSVQVWPSSYQWSFGDGSALDTESLGQPYPAQSDIQHVYQFSSLQTQSGFPVQVIAIFAAHFEVNGGTPQDLPPMSHTYTAVYPVQEAQSLLASH